MIQKLDQQWLNAPHLARIIKALGKEEVRFIGGCVRDALLYREITDVDMATRLVPEDVLHKLEKHGIKAIPTGIKHGTITAIVDNIPVEITTLRSDMECNGRHAQVTFTTSWEEDAQRRDFTINALSCSSDGTLYDYTGGMHDLTAKRLRFIGDARTRCQEDFLRILRYFRFFATLAIEKIDDIALSACEKEAEGISTLSGERIQHEMFRLLNASSPLMALKMMEKTAVLERILRAPASVDVIADIEALEKTLARAPDAILRLAAICRANKFDTAQLDKLISTWKLSNKDKTKLLALCVPEIAINVAHNEHAQKKLIRFYGQETYQQQLIIAWSLDENDDHYKKYLHWYELATTWKMPPFPLQGSDLMALGIPSGKELGTLLKQAENHWEEHNYQPSKKELLGWVKTKI